MHISYSQVAPYVVLASAFMAVVSLVLAVSALRANGRLKSRYLRIFGGERPEQLEDHLGSLKERLDQQEALLHDFSTRLQHLDSQSQTTLSHVGLVRFNPFDDTGSDLSFSLAILNEAGDGFVMTSLWGRDEVRLYAKPVARLESRYTLSQEEHQAIDLAAHQRQSAQS